MRTKGLKVLMVLLTIGMFYSFGAVWAEEQEMVGESITDTVVEEDSNSVQEDIYKDDYEVIQGFPFTEETAAELLQERGLLKGDEKGNLMLDKTLTRPEMMVVLSRLMGVEDQAKNYPVDNMMFKDVPRTGQYQHYIAWAYGSGLTKGKSPKEFGFKDYLTCWQTKAFFIRAMGYSYLPDDAIDASADSLGVTSRVSLEDEQPMPRGAMAMMMYNSLYASCSDGIKLGEKLGVTGAKLAEKLPKGNTPGNIVNGGLVAIQGDWVYYSNAEDGFKLYKSKLDGTQKARLNEDKSSYINVLGNWVYYQNNSDGDKLCKIGIDGNGKVVLVDETAKNIFVSGNWIYYTSGGAEQLAKIKLDGTGQEFIDDDGGEYPGIVGDRVFFDNLSNEGKIYSIGIDGRGKTEISSEGACFINVVNDWIYYVKRDGLRPFRIKTDGTGLEKLSEDMSLYLNVMGDWIYYSNGSDDFKLYKMKPDGTEVTKLSDDTDITDINLIKDWVYYLSGDALYRIKNDGTGRQKIQ